MILTLIAVGLIVIEILLKLIENVIEKSYKKRCEKEGRWRLNRRWYERISFDEWSFIPLIVGVVLTICFTFIIGYEHIGIENQMRKNNIQYESLCKRLEIVNSNYEDVSKSDVINDISEWNSYVVNAQYWAKNPWTSWFWPQEVVDNLKLIEY